VNPVLPVVTPRKRARNYTTSTGHSGSARRKALP
jgi:hypothetical protein